MRFKRIYLDYRIKLMAVIIFAASIILLLISLNRNAVLKELILERDKKRLDSIGKLVASEIDKYIRGKSVEDIRSILSLVDNQTEVEFVSIIAQNGVVEYSTIRNIEGYPNPYRDSGSMSKEIGEIYIKSFPIEVEDVNIGFVQTGYDMTPTRRTIQQSFRKSMISNFVLLTVIFITGWVLSDILMKPLDDVKEGAETIARGNFSVRLPVKSKDILGKLAQSMNEMARQLEDLTRNMQNKIDRATTNLKKTNEKLKRKSEELKEKNERLKELDKMKSDLVSMVSHELKTPLTSMIGFGKTILIRKLPENKVKKYLKIIVSEGKRLSYLVDEFLDISRIDSGEFKIIPHKFNLKDFFESEIEKQRSQNNAKIRLKLVNTDIDVKWDINAVKQVIFNLLDNACRYNPPEKAIDVTVAVRKSKVSIKVRDYGPGVRKEDTDKIFEKFYRAGDKVNAKTKGTGLGLSITKSIIELHGGSIQVRSPKGGGTEFVIRMPKVIESDE